MSSNRINTKLVATSVRDKYRYRVSLTIGFERIGARPKYSFNFWKASSHSSLYSSPFPFLIALKNEAHLSVDLAMNRLSEVRHPVSLCTSFNVFGENISSRVLIFSGFTSIPLGELENVGTFPTVLRIYICRV